jgi:hypothetical protein
LGYGSGIGTGYVTEAGRSSVGVVCVSDCEVLARASCHGSGIGTGYVHGEGYSEIDNLTICDSRVRAESFGHGCEAGYSLKGMSRVNSLTIVSSAINASGSSDAWDPGTGHLSASGSLNV